MVCVIIKFIPKKVNFKKGEFEIAWTSLDEK